MKKIILPAFVIIALYVVGCKENTTSPNPQSANIPVIANTTNAFSYTIVANAYSSTVNYDLSFSTDSLSCSLTVVNQTSGNGSIKISDSTNSTVYSDSSLSNKVLGFTQAHKGIPKNIRLVFANYTGTVTFALAGKKYQ